MLSFSDCFRKTFLPVRISLGELFDRLMDLAHRISVRQECGASELGYVGTDYHHYLPVSWLGLLRIMRCLDPKPGDYFLDVGCGKGRPLFAALKLPFAKVIGIDRSRQLCEIARNNIQTYAKGRQTIAARTEVHCVDASEYVVPLEARFILLACPFGRQSTRRFFQNLHGAAWESESRVIIAVNPLFLDEMNRCFEVRLERSWGKGWYKIYRIKKRACVLENETP